MLTYKSNSLCIFSLKMGYEMQIKRSIDMKTRVATETSDETVDKESTEYRHKNTIFPEIRILYISDP